MSFVFYIPLILLGIAVLAVAVVFLSNHLSQLQFQAGTANAKGSREGGPSTGGVLTDENIKKGRIRYRE